MVTWCIFRIYTTLKPHSSEVCSTYAPCLRLGAYVLQTSSDPGSRVVYTWNTLCNHDLYITYIYIYIYIYIYVLQDGCSVVNCGKTSMYSHYHLMYTTTTCNHHQRIKIQAQLPPPHSASCNMHISKCACALKKNTTSAS